MFVVYSLCRKQSKYPINEKLWLLKEIDVEANTYVWTTYISNAKKYVTTDTANEDLKKITHVECEIVTGYHS